MKKARRSLVIVLPSHRSPAHKKKGEEVAVIIDTSWLLSTTATSRYLLYLLSLLVLSVSAISELIWSSLSSQRGSIIPR
jgi:hypothetical protein